MTKIINVDSKPIYLGYQRDQNKYCFYAIKQGVPRFLSYIKYFFWDKGPQTALELKAINLELEQELIKFLEGRIGYEFFKQRKNSKESTVRKVYNLPEQYSTDGLIELPRESVPRSPVRRPKPVINSVGNPIVEPQVKPIEPTRRRNTRKPSDDTHVSLPSSKLVEPPKVEKVKSKTKAVEVIIDIPVDNTPSKNIVNPKMLKALAKLTKTSVVEVPVVPVVKTKRKKVVETVVVPVEEQKIKLGRSKKVPILENPKEVDLAVKAKDNGISIRLDLNETPKKVRKTRSDKIQK
jgi:hypothetical protein